MKAIVTGGSGFIGSYLVAELINEGFQVAAIGRKNIGSLPPVRKKLLQGSNYFNLDLDNPNQIHSKLKEEGFIGPDLKYFFHLAWGGNYGLSDLDIEAQTKNINRTIATYDIAQELNVNRYIFCGTMEESFAETYTDLDYKNNNKYNRHVVYALAKISARHALKIRYAKGGPELIFGTNSHTMGPGDIRDSFLQESLTSILNKKDIFMSSGDQIFDVINVKDCAKAYISIANKGIPGTSYWIGSGEPRKLKEYIQIMNNLFFHVKIEYGSLPYNDVILDKKIFNTDKIKLDTGFLPKISFSDTVTQLAEFIRSNK